MALTEEIMDILHASWYHCSDLDQEKMCTFRMFPNVTIHTFATTNCEILVIILILHEPSKVASKYKDYE